MVKIRLKRMGMKKKPFTVLSSLTSARPAMAASSTSWLLQPGFQPG